MKKRLAIFLLVLTSQTAYAALPPQYQNMDDLDVMVNFIRQHERVAAELVSIELRSYTVHYGKDCKAEFKRDYVPKPDGWVGPADPLIFDKSNCPVDYDDRR